MNNFITGKLTIPLPLQRAACVPKKIGIALEKEFIATNKKLANAVKKAGGANGYLIVLEINDEQKTVTLEEILPYIKQP